MGGGIIVCLTLGWTMLQIVTGQSQRLAHDAVTSSFADIGHYDDVYDHNVYSHIVDKTQTWLDYVESSSIKTCALQTAFQFDLELHGKFVKETSLNVSCGSVTEWVQQNWIRDVDLHMCWEKKQKGPCIWAVGVGPPGYCRYHRPGDMGHSATSGSEISASSGILGNSEILTNSEISGNNGISVCGEYDTGSGSILDHLRDYLTCGSQSGPYLVEVDVIVAVYDSDDRCVPGMSDRDDVIRDLMQDLPSRPAMVELSTQLVETCQGSLSCGDNTCYSPTERCNFKRDCVRGEDEALCWCESGNPGNKNHTKMKSSIAPTGFVCDFEPIGTGVKEYCAFCPWGQGNFNISQGQNTTQYFPTIDATEGTQLGHFLYASQKTKTKDPDQIPYLLSTCLGSTGPNCEVRFKYITHGNSGRESIKVVKLPSCMDLPGGPAILPLKEVQAHNGVKWNSAWTHVGEHTTPFRLALSATIIDHTSIVAVDALELRNCRPDIDSLVQCQPGEFECKTHKCINQDLMCNLMNDCLCEEDEKHIDCDKVPFYAKTNFKNCDLNDGSCWWHNNPDNTRYRWTLENKKDETFANINFAHGRKSEAAGLDSVIYAPPPPGHNGLCKVRFYLHTEGRHVYRLDVVVKEEGRPERSLKTIKLNMYTEMNWHYVTVPITNVTRRFHLQFKAYVGMRAVGNLSVNHITLSPQCFDPPSHEFNTCGATGHMPPSPADCHKVYRGETETEVLTAGRFQGAQRWTVPKHAVYSITAMGASGGLGARSTVGRIPYGTLVHAKFNLTKGEKLYFLIGQEGESACSTKKKYNTGHVCNSHNVSDPSVLIGGGGGGGGATYVFKVDEDTQSPHLLMVAGGGGGMGATAHMLHRPEGANPGSGKQGLFRKDGIGGGSGWAMSETDFIAMASGGKPCQVSVTKGFDAHGGFGGGAGGCTSGGGGGGYTGGSACKEDEELCSGHAGTSYVNPVAIQDHARRDDPGRKGDGFVDVLEIRDCPCDYYCIWEDKDATSFRCLCPSSYLLAADGVSCLESNMTRQGSPALLANDDMSSDTNDVGFIIAITTACVIIFIMMGTTCFCVCRQGGLSKDCTGGGLQLETFMSYCKMKKLRNGQRQRPPNQRPTAVIEFNPNYDFISANHPQVLHDINRRHLQLVKALGQGAFGEVYKGLLSHVPHVEGKLPVAVKTLPAISTDQTEFDFQMEAIIVSKFNHPNIVKFLGVCFEARPRFIVLELLEGGDLKSFLRDSRPKPSEPSSLTVMDLLKLASDIARGCHHLEEKHFIHRDIAARNCLLTTRGPDRQAKIADFGMARDIYRSDYYKKAGNALLPVKWMPPEAFLDGIFTTKTDIWSFGILLWEIFSLGYMPYPGCSNEEVMHFVTVGGRLEAPDSCPSSVYDIMASCWSGLAEERPPFSLILSSLEKCMQDEDITSKGLRILYLPKLSVARGFKLPVKTPGSGDRGQGSSDGYLEPLLPSWITDDLPNPRLVNNEDLSDEETHLKSKHPKPSNDSTSPKTHCNHSTHSMFHDPRRLPSPEVPLLSVEDFQILFEKGDSHSHDEKL